MPKVLAATMVVVLLAGCAVHRRPGPAGEPGALRSDDLDSSSLVLAATRTADALDSRPPRGEARVGGRSLPAASLAKTARRVAELARSEKDPAALARRLAAECDAWPVAPAAKVTGYYEPVLAARTAPDARFRYALYRAPSLQQMQVLARRLGRVPTRADIDGRHALAGLGLEIAWTDDPVARFFLHVQGSGRLVFPGGRSRRVGFAGA